MTISDVKKTTETRMHKTLEALKVEFSHVRTGRAHTGLLDDIKVDYYGAEMPISQVGNVGLADARTITIQPWEKRKKIRKKTRFTQTILQVVQVGSTEAQFCIPSWNPHAIIGIPASEFPVEMHDDTHVIAWANLAAETPEDLRICRFEPANYPLEEEEAGRWNGRGQDKHAHPLLP